MPEEPAIANETPEMTPLERAEEAFFYSNVMGEFSDAIVGFGEVGYAKAA